MLGSFPSDGTGVGNPEGILGPDDSDQNVIVNPEGTLLFSVNGGSDTIAVFHIHADGSLGHVDGSPFPSGGVQPVSLGLAGDRLYVVNKDQDPARPSTSAAPNYTGFRVDPRGRLSPVPGSTVTRARGASPSQALIAPTGDLLFGADLLSGVLQSFRIIRDGRLEQRSPTSVGFPVPGPLGLAAHPARPLLYAGLPGANRLACFRLRRRGCLDAGDERAQLRQGTVLGRGQRRRDTAVHLEQRGRLPLGLPPRRAHPSNGDPAPATGRPEPVPAGDGPSGRFVYVVAVDLSAKDPSANALYEFAVMPDGTLELAAPPAVLPVSAGTHSAGVVVT